MILEVSCLLEKINYTLSFPCGKHWYHGISIDFDNNDGPCGVIYHKTLDKIYGFDLPKEIKLKINTGLKKGKIYNVFSWDCNIPCSIEDISSNIEDYRILFPIYLNSDIDIWGINERDYESNDHDLKKLLKKRKESIRKFIKSSGNKIILLPVYLQSFISILISEFIWVVDVKTTEFVVFKLSNGGGNYSYNYTLIKDSIRYKNQL